LGHFCFTLPLLYFLQEKKMENSKIKSMFSYKNRSQNFTI
jgi:hypothetical protein